MQRHAQRAPRKTKREGGREERHYSSGGLRSCRERPKKHPSSGFARFPFVTRTLYLNRPLRARARALVIMIYTLSPLLLSAASILEFIHNSAACNIPLRRDGARDATSVSIIHHAALHTGQLILIIHSYRGRAFEKESSTVRLWER